MLRGTSTATVTFHGTITKTNVASPNHAVDITDVVDASLARGLNVIAQLVSREQAVEWFDLDHVVKSAARFDYDKLESLNTHYIKLADDERLVGAPLTPETDQP